MTDMPELCSYNLATIREKSVKLFLPAYRNVLVIVIIIYGGILRGSKFIKDFNFSTK